MDVVSTLVHDHAALNQKVLAIGAALRSDVTSTSAALEPQLVALRDTLFHHFALEEEGLFPFVARVAPQLDDEVRVLLHAHDTICGSLARMVGLAKESAAVIKVGVLFERFASAYSDHSQRESTLLGQLDRLLDAAQRVELSALVALL